MFGSTHSSLWFYFFYMTVAMGCVRWKYLFFWCRTFLLLINETNLIFTIVKKVYELIHNIHMHMCVPHTVCRLVRICKWFFIWFSTKTIATMFTAKQWPNVKWFRVNFISHSDNKCKTINNFLLLCSFFSFRFHSLNSVHSFIAQSHKFKVKTNDTIKYWIRPLNIKHSHLHRLTNRRHRVSRVERQKCYAISNDFSV